MYNYVGIDISLSSTGIFILLKDGTEYYFNYKNNTKLTKWHHCLSFINYRDYEISEFDEFSDNEIGKLIKHNEIANKMINDILQYCKPEETIVATENYSYSSRVGHLVHLVQLGTMVRQKLLEYNFVDFKLLPPSTLKMKTCELVYGLQYNVKGKKVPSKNNLGITGGKFTKFEFLTALMEYDIINPKIKQILKPHYNDLSKMKSLPSPISDMIDALFLAYVSIL